MVGERSGIYSFFVDMLFSYALGSFLIMTRLGALLCMRVACRFHASHPYAHLSICFKLVLSKTQRLILPKQPQSDNPSPNQTLHTNINRVPTRVPLHVHPFTKKFEGRALEARNHLQFSTLHSPFLLPSSPYQLPLPPYTI